VLAQANTLQGSAVNPENLCYGPVETSLDALLHLLSASIRGATYKATVNRKAPAVVCRGFIVIDCVVLVCLDSLIVTV